MLACVQAFRSVLSEFDMKQDQLARKIVANLAYRYRVADKCLTTFLKEQKKPMSESERDYMEHLDGCRSEAFHAYVSSKLVLLGLE